MDHVLVFLIWFTLPCHCLYMFPSMGPPISLQKGLVRKAPTCEVVFVCSVMNFIEDVLCFWWHIRTTDWILRPFCIGNWHLESSTNWNCQAIQSNFPLIFYLLARLGYSDIQHRKFTIPSHFQRAWLMLLSYRVHYLVPYLPLLEHLLHYQNPFQADYLTFTDVT